MDKVIEQVRKLMALAENTSFPEEAQSAMLVAQKLMAKHSITSRDLRVEEERAQEEVMMTVGRRDTFVSVLANVITENFRCASLWRKASLRVNGRLRSAYTLTFLGLEEDVAVASEVFSSAKKAAESLARDFVREHGGGRRVRNSYLLGWAHGLARKFDEQKKTNRTVALAVMKPKAVQDALDKMDFEKPEKRNVAVDPDSYLEGEKDGRLYGVGVG